MVIELQLGSQRSCSGGGFREVGGLIYFGGVYAGILICVSCLCFVSFVCASASALRVS